MNCFARATVLLSAFVVIAHAGLIPLGFWQPDEYHQLSLFRDGSLASVVVDLLKWTPRPVHILLVGLYASVVEWSATPAVGPTLAFAWAIAFASLYFAARAHCKNPFAIALSVFAALLLVGRPAEVFYWPVGLSAYLPTVVGIASASLLLMRDLSGKRYRVGLAISLAVAAASSEMGAVFVLSYAILRLLSIVLTGQRKQHDAVWAWLAPGVLALVEIGIFFTNRATLSGETMQSGAATLDALWPSVTAALPALLWEITALPMLPGDTTDLVLGLPLKLALFLGLRPGPGSRVISQERRNEGVIRALALLATCFLSLYFAFNHFGVICCPRHETARQIMIILAIASATLVCPTRSSVWITTSRGRAALVLLPLVVLMARRSVQLPYDYRLYSEASEAHRSTWSSGSNQASSSMRYVNPPKTKVINHWRLEPGIYKADDSESPTSSPLWHSQAILRFFEKSELRVDTPDLEAPRR